MRFAGVRDPIRKAPSDRLPALIDPAVALASTSSFSPELPVTIPPVPLVAIVPRLLSCAPPEVSSKLPRPTASNCGEAGWLGAEKFYDVELDLD